jgi:signal transduction histidine kinase
VTSPDARRSARLLAMISLANIALVLTELAQLSSNTAAEFAGVLVPILVATAGLYALVYVLARLARNSLSAWVTVGAQFSIPIAVGSRLHGIDVEPRSSAAWLSLAVLTASATLGWREVVLVGAAAIASMMMLMRYLGATVLAVNEAAFFLGTATVLTGVYAKHRDALEADRQALLRDRNLELEQLQSTLEERVVDRTARLEESRGELERTNETLVTSHALLVQTEKMAAVGRLTAGIAHELASPLSAALAALHDLAGLTREYTRSIGDENVTLDDHRAIAKDLASATALASLANQRALKFVKGIRAHTRDTGTRATEQFALDDVVAEVVEMLGHAARAANVRIAVEGLETPLRITAVPSRVNQVLTNLVKNAIDAIGSVTGRPASRGVVTVRVRREAAEVRIEVDDDGSGIEPSVLSRIFEPLFTTKAYGQGTGLGLSIVKEIVETELHGSIVVQSQVGSGTTFVVRFPTNER